MRGRPPPAHLRAAAAGRAPHDRDARDDAAALTPSPRLSIAVGVVVLALYLALTPPVPGDKDASELTLVLATFGVAHPTGYPLYTWLGGVFVHALRALGFGWDWAANAWSAVGGALAVALLHALATRMNRSAGAPAGLAAALALLPAGLFGLHPAWTLETTLAEVNAWHLAWVAWAMLLAFDLLERDPHRLPPRARDFACWGLCVGVGLTHHMTSVFVSLLLSALLLERALRARVLPVRLVLLGTLCAAAPLLAYAHVFWRAAHPAVGQWGTLGPDWDSVRAHLIGTQYRVYFGRFAPSPAQRELVERFVWPVLLPALAGLLAWAYLARRTSPRFRIGMVAAVGCGLAYAFVYGVPDPSAYFLPPLLLALAASSACLAGLRLPSTSSRVVAAWALAALAVVAWVWIPLAARRAEDYVVRDRALHALWRSIAHEHGFIAWSDDMVARLRQYQLLFHEKPGLDVVHPLALTQDWPRHVFTRRYGFDPVSRPAIAAGALLARPRTVQEMSAVIASAVVQEINAQSPLPVLLFDADGSAFTLLEKAARDSLPL